MSMNPSHIDPDDPRLTAYALGELTDPAERAEIEQLLVDSPIARAEVEEIRAFTAALTGEYEQERTAAEAAVTTTTAAPVSAPNVIAMPTARRFRWVSPLLKIAAVLLALGTLVIMSLPVFTDVRFELFKPNVSSASMVQLRAKEQPAAKPASPPILASRVEPAFESAPVAASATPAAPTASGPMLAQNEPEQKRDFGLAPAPIELKPSTRSREVASADAPSDERGIDDRNQTLQAGRRGPVPQAGIVGGMPSKSSAAIAPADASGMGGALAASSKSLIRPKALPVQSLASADKNSANEQFNMQLPNTVNQPVYSTRTDKDGKKHEEFQGYVNYGSPIAQSAAPALSPDAIPEVRIRRENTSLDDVSSLPQSGVASASELPLGNSVTTNAGQPYSANAKRGPVSQSGVAGGVARAIGGESRAADGEPLTITSADKGTLTITLFRDKAVTPALNTATYDHLVENPFLAAKENPLSTFSIDVDTASYANVRRFIESGSLPPPDAVRIEELLNYFPYNDAPPTPGEENGKPFAIHLEAAACPWATDHRLVRIGIKGRELAADKRPPSNLVFLLDVSGSMMPPERLPLIKESLRLLVEQLTEDDRVAIVVYAGASGLALPSTTGDHKERILRALGDLRPGGSTNGASGIQLAYKVAQEGLIKGGTNRVILATDGDFNVGVTNQGDLVRLIQEKAKGGVFLSVLGVGTDNYKDSTMQKLADKGNGNYAYIDRIEEARKVLVEQMTGTLVTIAKDVKIQVEFNPATVAEYRLIGYEKRMLRKEDFNNDKIDAGEIGAGHSVTALYEIVPAGQKSSPATPAVDPLKYQIKLDSVPTSIAEAPEVQDPQNLRKEPTPVPDAAPVAPGALELLTLKMRYKAPEADKSERTFDKVLIDRGASGEYANASADFKFAAAVASFGLTLRDSPYKGSANFGAAIEMAQEGKGTDASGYRAGFIELARRAQTLQNEARSSR